MDYVSPRIISKYRKPYGDFIIRRYGFLYEVTSSLIEAPRACVYIRTSITVQWVEERKNRGHSSPSSLLFIIQFHKNAGYVL